MRSSFGPLDRVARLADDARMRAFEVLGKRVKAVEIMERRLAADWEAVAPDFKPDSATR